MIASHTPGVTGRRGDRQRPQPGVEVLRAVDIADQFPGLQRPSTLVMIVVEFIANQPSHDGYRRDGS